MSGRVVAVAREPAAGLGSAAYRCLGSTFSCGPLFAEVRQREPRLPVELIGAKRYFELAGGRLRPGPGSTFGGTGRRVRRSAIPRFRRRGLQSARGIVARFDGEELGLRRIVLGKVFLLAR